MSWRIHGLETFSLARLGVISGLMRALLCSPREKSQKSYLENQLQSLRHSLVMLTL
jgi:hypothetical protein